MINIEEVAKTMTREDFLNEAKKVHFGKFNSQNDCPKCFGLKKLNNLCSNFDDESCKECWENAVKDIKFKDDMEVKKVSKKLNIIEAMKMPIGTEFEVHYDDGGKAIKNMILKENENERKYLDWVDGDYLKVFEFLTEGATFIPIQQPVSFMEVVKAATEGKKIKYKVDENYGMFNYENLKSALKTLCFNDSLKVAEILQGPYWYIEESESELNEN